MRSLQAPKRLYFIEGMVPTPEDVLAANELDGRVSFRNAHLVDNDGASALEECDSVHGKVPPRYKAAFPENNSGSVSGIGALRALHDGETGVSENQALHLNSTATGDPIEEERRRAHRGVPINDPSAARAEPGRLDPANAWGLPFGIPGAAQLTAGQVSQIRSEQQGEAGSTTPLTNKPADAKDGAGSAAETGEAGSTTDAGGQPGSSAGQPTWNG